VDKKGMTLIFLRRTKSWNRRSPGKEGYTDERGDRDDLPVAQGNEAAAYRPVPGKTRQGMNKSASYNK